jgi:hypothetical protein
VAPVPGRYGHAIHALDHLLQAIGCEAVVAGGWAVWRHGYLGRVTQDVDIVVPAGQIDELLRAAAVSGFEVLPAHEVTWPKLRHKNSHQNSPLPLGEGPGVRTEVIVNILPEGATPGSPSKPAPTTIPHPSHLGAGGNRLQYADLPGLIELKLAAGRARDDSDVVELIRANPDQIDTVRQHLGKVHHRYQTTFDELVERAQEQTDR